MSQNSSVSPTLKFGSIRRHFGKQKKLEGSRAISSRVVWSHIVVFGLVWFMGAPALKAQVLSVGDASPATANRDSLFGGDSALSDSLSNTTEVEAADSPSHTKALEADRWRQIFRDTPTRARTFHAASDELSWRLRRITRREQGFAGFGGVAFVLWDERYFDSRDRGWGAETGFEQNRTFAGFTWRRNDSSRSRMELGYLNQEWDEPGADDRRFHFLSFGFNF